MQKQLDDDNGNAAVDLFRNYLHAEGAQAYLLRDDELILIAARGELGRVLEDAFHRDADKYALHTGVALKRHSDPPARPWWVGAAHALSFVAVAVVAVAVFVFATFGEFFFDVDANRSAPKERFFVDAVDAGE